MIYYSRAIRGLITGMTLGLWICVGIAAYAEEAKLPVMARIVTVEQSCIENGTLCDKLKPDDSGESLAEIEPASGDETKKNPEIEINFE